MFPVIVATAKLVIGAAMVASPAQHAHTHVVQPNESLWSISASDGHNWQHLYALNRDKINDPNLIYPKEVLRTDGQVQTAQTSAVVEPTAAPAHHDQFDGKRGDCGDGDGDGMDAPCSVIFPHRYAPVVRHTYSSVRSSGYAGTTSYEACVIARESGGNSQVMNSSGHYGLYQFSASTWVAYGGNPADFGRASPSEQRQVFLNAMAQGGQSNWSPYDGC